MKRGNKLLFLVVGGILYLLAVGWALVTGYTYFGRNQEYILEIKQKESELERVRKRVEEDLPGLREDYTRYYQKAKNLRKFTPTREEQERVVVSIEQLANSAGVQIRSCRMQEDPRPVEGMSAYQAYTWEISCSGRYAQMDRFLTLLDKADRLMKIAELSVWARSLQDEPGRYILDIDLQLDLIVRTEG